MKKVDYYKDEIKYPGLITRGSSDKMAVHRIQENINLTYRFYNKKDKIKVDDDFGDLTFKALKDIQNYFGLYPSGELDEKTWDYMVKPIKHGFTITSGETDELRQNVLNRCDILLNCSPIELGKNSGPWVRSFMLGKDGEWAAWCAGSICTIYYLEAQRLLDRGVSVPPMAFEYSWSVPNMVREAKAEGRWINPNDVMSSEFECGDFFVVYNPKSEFIYTHIGIIVGIDKKNGIIYTVEGNTNDEGIAEGYEWCKRMRKINTGTIGIIKIK